MPSYDYRCNTCGRAVTLKYKTYKDYDMAVPECPHCNSRDLTRVINRVAVSRPSRDYAQMSSQEMLSVMEGGNSQEMGELFQQVGQTGGDVDQQYQEVTDRLLKGDKPDKIESDLKSSSET